MSTVMHIIKVYLVFHSLIMTNTIGQFFNRNMENMYFVRCVGGGDSMNLWVKWNIKFQNTKGLSSI